MRVFLVASLLFVGCGGSPDRVEISVSPDIVSSQSGTLTAKATVFGGSAGVSAVPVLLHVDYTDRNGTAHPIQDVTAKTNEVGEAEVDFTGLTFEGVGTITATALDDKNQPLVDSAKQPVITKGTFSVLDLSPPVVTITNPAANATVGSASAQNGFQFTVTIAAADEIGVSQTFFQAVSGQNGNLTLNRTGSRINGSGSTSVTIDYQVGGQGGGGGGNGNMKAGDTITLTAMATDLSGNIGVAPAVNVVVGP